MYLTDSLTVNIIYVMSMSRKGNIVRVYMQGLQTPLETACDTEEHAKAVLMSYYNYLYSPSMMPTQ